MRSQLAEQCENITRITLFYSFIVNGVKCLSCSNTRSGGVLHKAACGLVAAEIFPVVIFENVCELGLSVKF